MVLCTTRRGVYIFDAAMEWVDENKNAKDFFLMVETFDPHEPFDIPEKYLELYNDDCFKTKKEKNRINYYINKLNEFERLLNDWSINNYTCIYIVACILL